MYDWQRGTTAEHVTAAAIAASSGLRRYVFMSSVGAYGPGFDYDERDPLTPSTDTFDYRRNKAESERALFALHREQGLPVTTLRPAFVYGPHNPFDRESFFGTASSRTGPSSCRKTAPAPCSGCSPTTARAAILAAGNDVAAEGAVEEHVRPS